MKNAPPKHACPECDFKHWSPSEVEAFKEHFTNCVHCKKPVFYDYFLKPAVWKKTGVDYHGGVLHLPCVEELIGRLLEFSDFDFSVKKQGQCVNDAIAWALAHRVGSLRKDRKK